MATNKALNEYIMSVLVDPKVQRLFPSLGNPQFVCDIEDYLNMNTGQLFKKVYKIQNTSAGLQNVDNNIVLSEDWGVKLAASLQPTIIDTPVNIRTKSEKFLVANGGTSASPVLCSVFDQNLNYIGPVGKKGTTYASGEYQEASDFNLHAGNGHFYITSSVDHIVQVYDQVRTYTFSLGTGVAGADGTTLTNPVAVDFNLSNVMVVCNAGTPAGATGPGFLAVYDFAGNFQSIPLYHGKNGGTGRCIEGEITQPKDIFVAQKGTRDLVYILNGTDEIGVFNSTDWSLKEVINIPSSITDANLGLSRITVADNILYVTAANIGQVIGIDLDTKELVGTFGTLSAETASDAPLTLGYFNGLNGVAILGDMMYVSESLNNRIQAFGSSLIADSELTITFESVKLGIGKKLVDVSYSLEGDIISDLVLVDKVTGAEYTRSTAIARNLNDFYVRLKLQPSLFSRKKPVFDIYPVYILVEA
jgi:hypothetical protein